MSWGICHEGAKDCVDRTNGYGNSFLQTGNRFERCASCVSAFICEIVAFGNAIGPLLGLLPRLTSIEIIHCLECMGNCMYEKWKYKEGPYWQHAVRSCQKNGSASKQCCIASIDAEQHGYTECANQCGCSAFNVISVQNRVGFGTNVLHCWD